MQIWLQISGTYDQLLSALQLPRLYGIIRKYATPYKKRVQFAHVAIYGVQKAEQKELSLRSPQDPVEGGILADDIFTVYGEYGGFSSFYMGNTLVYGNLLTEYPTINAKYVIR